MTPSYAIPENVTWRYSHFGSKWCVWGKRIVIFLRQEKNTCALREIYLTCELERLKNNDDNCSVYLKVYSYGYIPALFCHTFFFSWLFFGFKWSYLYSISLSLWVVVCYSVKTVTFLCQNLTLGMVYSHIEKAFMAYFWVRIAVEICMRVKNWVHWISQWY